MGTVPGMARMRELNGGAPPGWKKADVWEAPCEPANSPPVDASLKAVISTWFDADIIAANVRNCFANGFDEVFILDNDSPDNSVQAALSAGATLAEVYRTEFYDDDLRIRKQNEIIQREVPNGPAQQWWVTLDADEFITGRGGERLRETLFELPPHIRTVGSDVVDLYPTEGCQYVPGEHPAKIFPYGVRKREGRGTYCRKGHYKHVFLRYLNNEFDIAQTRGNHVPAVSGRNLRLWEPDFMLPFFHAPFRRKEDMERRLSALCGKDVNLGGRHRSAGDDEVTGGNGAVKRWRSLEHVYAGQWDRVEMAHSQLYGRSVVGIALYPWRVIFPELAEMF